MTAKRDKPKRATSGDAAPKKSRGRTKAKGGAKRKASRSRSADEPSEKSDSKPNRKTVSKRSRSTRSADDISYEAELGIGSRVVPPSMGYDEEPEEDAAPRSQAGETPEDVEAQIRALEARLDGMIKNAGGDSEPPSIRAQVGTAAREVVERLAAPLPLDANADENVVEAARELFSSDYFLRQWGRIGMRNRSEEVDDFGLDPTYEKRVRPLFDFLSRRYFRTEVSGAENIPDSGRCIIVANHSGTLPLDGIMLRTAVRNAHPAARELRWLTEDFVHYLPFVGAFMNRVGAVRACQENAERLLAQDNLLAVFPEGIKGIAKLYKNRYRLQRFGRGGFIRLCLRTQTPLVPCAVVGAEEANPMLYRWEFMTKTLNLPYVPITPTFPWLGPLGLLPAPSKWQMKFGEIMRFDGYGPEAADDHVLVGRLAERVRGSIQSMLESALRSRQSVWLG